MVNDVAVDQYISCRGNELSFMSGRQLKYQSWVYVIVIGLLELEG